MKSWQRSVVCGLVLVLASANLSSAEAAPRTWTSVNGTTIEAEFVRISSRGVVTLKLKTGMDQDVPLGQFSPADQVYLRRVTAGQLPQPQTSAPPAANFSAAAVPLEQMTSDPERNHTPLPAKASAAIRAAEAGGQTIDVRSEKAKTQFDFYRDLPADGGVLIGFDITVAPPPMANDVSPVVRGLFPIFLTSKGKVIGERQGYAGEKKLHLEAKPGYAVGRIQMCGGLRIQALKLTYMRLTTQGLDPSDAYESPVYGSASDDLLPPVGDGSLIVGIHGIGRRSGNVYSLGVVILPTSP
ncbi:MAG: hypothetical protein K8U03_07855 [Planctomycetia bacterium]|nr:hypothetical protein [Planctomycetia bacterium]